MATSDWRLDENGVDRDLIFKHLFYKHLKGSPGLPIDEVVESIELLDEAFWQKAEELMPVSWKGNNFKKIQQHTQAVVANLSDFKNEIRRILS